MLLNVHTQWILHQILMSEHFNGYITSQPCINDVCRWREIHTQQCVSFYLTLKQDTLIFVSQTGRNDKPSQIHRTTSVCFSSKTESLAWKNSLFWGYSCEHDWKHKRKYNTETKGRNKYIKSSHSTLLEWRWKSQCDVSCLTWHDMLTWRDETIYWCQPIKRFTGHYTHTHARYVMPCVHVTYATYMVTFTASLAGPKTTGHFPSISLISAKSNSYR